jgi:microcystin degradation protein MlrC
MLGKIDAKEEIMDSSLLVGMAWADVTHAGASAIAVAVNETCLDEALEGACRLAKAYWNTRYEFRLEVEAYSAEEAAKQAQSADRHPFFISDSGDNVTAGAPGDLPIMVEQLLRNRVTDAVVGGIQDREAVEACRHAGAGATLRLEIGGKLDQIHGYPFEVRGRVLYCTEKGAVFRVNGVKIILIANAQRFTTPADFLRFGIDPTTQSVIVVKQGYLFPELRKIATNAIMALTPGCTDLNIERLGYQNISRPMFPVDNKFHWIP